MPTSTDNADIYNGGTVTITTTGDGCNTLAIGDALGASGAIQMISGGLTVSNNALVGYSGTGTFTQSGGTTAISGSLCLGFFPGRGGTYNLDGPGQLSTLSETVGFYGTGNFTQSGGTNTTSNELFLGQYSDSNGTYTLSGSGLLSTYTESVGYSGSGNFTQSGGTNAISSSLYLGYGAGSIGTYTLTGTGTLSAASEILVGNSGTGWLQWLTSTSTLSTPTLALWSASTLTMGFDFDMGALTSGTLFHGSALTGLAGSAAGSQWRDGKPDRQHHGGGWDPDPRNNRWQRHLQPQRFRAVVRGV